MVTNNLATVKKPKLSEEELGVIETWLAAHFYSIRVKQVASEKADVVGQSFQYKHGLKLESTMYGQQAVAMDRTGTLRRMNRNKGSKIGGHWLGTAAT